jgi:hypothetical protein
MQSLQYGSGDPDELEVAVKTKAKTLKTNNQASFGGSPGS